MKRIYTNQDSILCNFLKSVLESNEIPCFVRNESVSALAGRIPFTEVWPELWVYNDSQFDEACQIVQKATEKRDEARDV